MAKLNLYEVPVRNHVTTMQLSDDDVKAYKDRGVDITKVGSVEPAQRQDVTQPPHAVDEDGNDLPESEPGVRRRGRQPKNKAAE